MLSPHTWGGKTTKRVIQRLMGLITYKGWVKTGWKRKKKWVTLLWVYIYIILTFGTILMLHMLKMGSQGWTFIWVTSKKKSETESVKSLTQSCPTPCGPMDCSLPGSSSMEFSKQEYWSSFPFPSPRNLPNPGMNPGLLLCRQILYCLSHQNADSASLGLGELVLKHLPFWQSHWGCCMDIPRATIDSSRVDS